VKLRVRLVLALTVLALAVLPLFGAITYTLYARSEYARLDDRIRSSVPFVGRELRPTGDDASTSTDGSGDRAAVGQQGPGGPPPEVPVSTYAELRGPDGKVIAKAQLAEGGQPDLPDTILPPTEHEHFFTTGSASGSGEWRVLTTAGQNGTVVIAVPMGDVTNALHRLLLIQFVGGAVLLAVLCGGAWVVVRRGLRPLEQMAHTAASIAGGDLTSRVEVTEGASEVGELGLALNVMLDDIEDAFAERDATEQRLRQFLADASHELRTPLTSIQGFAELFRIGDQDQVDLPTVLRRIEEESARMKVLVEDLLLLARLDQTRPVELAPVDLAVLAADACTDAVAVAPDRRVTLHAPEPVVVQGDEALLRQALANLVSNVVRHTPAGSPIEVDTHREAGTALVSVRDHGDGLRPEARAKVFDRFWQADPARVGAGSGLGLSIVAGVAAEHGGSVEVADAAGGGAVFTMRIPSPVGG
jgi:two-component system OmpR family sensor kinase